MLNKAFLTDAHIINIIVIFVSILEGVRCVQIFCKTRHVCLTGTYSSIIYVLSSCFEPNSSEFLA